MFDSPFFFPAHSKIHAHNENLFFLSIQFISFHRQRHSAFVSFWLSWSSNEFFSKSTKQHSRHTNEVVVFIWIYCIISRIMQIVFLCVFGRHRNLFSSIGASFAFERITFMNMKNHEIPIASVDHIEIWKRKNSSRTADAKTLAKSIWK